MNLTHDVVIPELENPNLTLLFTCLKLFNDNPDQFHFPCWLTGVPLPKKEIHLGETWTDSFLEIPTCFHPYLPQEMPIKLAPTFTLVERKDNRAQIAFTLPSDKWFEYQDESFRIELHGDLNGTVSLDERTGLLQDYASTMAPYLLFQTLNPSGEPETIRLTFHINNNSTIRKL